MANVKVLPDELIASGEYVKKSLTDTEENYNIVISSQLSGEVKQVFWGGKDDVIEALKNHQPVICSMKGGKFTNGGHFIVLTGITEDGKILVNDPYGGNYNKASLQDGFENGFDFDTDIRRDCQSYFIYPSKEEVMKEKKQQSA